MAHQVSRDENHEDDENVIIKMEAPRHSGLTTQWVNSYSYP